MIFLVLDAEVLLISQPYSRILCSRKTPQTNVLKFLICKGLTPQPDMTKGDLCLAFKTLIESHPNYIRPSVQPVQSIQSMQMMPAASNMLALSQNNNMMHVPPYQSHMQQVCILYRHFNFILRKSLTYVSCNDINNIFD